MSIGKKIKQFRELKNYTQSYVAEKIGITVGGYSKIERDETDLTISRLNQIAVVLETDLQTILNFESKNIFNQTHNKTANAIVHNLQINENSELKVLLNHIIDEISEIKLKIN